jgi:hypothetical protein
MKWIMLFVSLVATTAAWAGSYTISSDGTQENTITFFSTRLGLTNQQTLQQICDSALASYFQQRTKIDAEDAARAFQQASPEDQEAICVLLANSGYVCPPAP